MSTHLVIVPNVLHDAIHRAIDREIAILRCDDRARAEACREHLYDQLLAYYNEHGEIPDFGIVKKEPQL